MPCYVGNGMYRQHEDGAERELVFMGIDPSFPPFRLLELQAAAAELTKSDTAIMDRVTGNGYSPVPVGRTTEVDGHRVLVVGSYAHGASFVCNATMIVSDQTFRRILRGYPLSDVNLGLVKVASDVNVASVVDALRAVLPPDVNVWSRADIEASEQRFYVRVKPLGLMFGAGVLLAFVVGAVILYQVLASEVMNRLREYATLKAIGYRDGYLSWIVIQQGMMLAIGAYFPATLMSLALYAYARSLTKVPMIMTTERVFFVFGLAMVLCCASVFPVIRKVASADPVDLF
jgi:putative ABC transport system permease protein